MGLKIEYRTRTKTGRKKVGANPRSRAKALHKWRQDMMKRKTTNIYKNSLDEAAAVRAKAKKKAKKKK